jgi:hypothetical protein
VQVKAKKPERADNAVDRYGAAAAAEQTVEGVEGQLSPTARGDPRRGWSASPGSR